LKGDEQNVHEVTTSIEAWLKTPGLLDPIVGEPAQANLINALKRTPKDKGLDEGVQLMLEALRKYYPVKPTAPAPSPAPVVPATDMKSFLAMFSDEALFGDKRDDYNMRRNDPGKGGLLPVNMAILEIKRYLRGEEPNIEVSRDRVLVWLNS